MELLYVIGIGGAAVGLVLAAAGIGVAIARSGGPDRILGGGIALEGMSIAATSAAVFLISRLGEPLPLVAGVVAITIVVVTALRLQRGASRAFREYATAKSGS
jgi:hypothetical protein